MEMTLEQGFKQLHQSFSHFLSILRLNELVHQGCWCFVERLREVRCLFPVCGVDPLTGSMCRGPVPLLGTKPLLFHHLSRGFRHCGNGIWGAPQVLSVEEGGERFTLSRGCPAAPSDAG